MKTRSSPPLNRTLSQQKTRKALLTAAASLIAKNGYAGASVRDIASHAGFTQGAFYSNFESKDDLTLEVMRALFHETFDSAAAILEAQPGDPDTLITNLKNWLETLTFGEEKSLLEIELNQHARRDAAFAKRYFALAREHEAKVSELLQKIVETGNARPNVPVAMVAQGLFALARGLMLTSRPDRDEAPGRVINYFLEAVLEKRCTS
jgi:AcrR family transcriptional regulator